MRSKGRKKDPLKSQKVQSSRDGPRTSNLGARKRLPVFRPFVSLRYRTGDDADDDGAAVMANVLPLSWFESSPVGLEWQERDPSLRKALFGFPTPLSLSLSLSLSGLLRTGLAELIPRPRSPRSCGRQREDERRGAVPSAGSGAERKKAEGAWSGPVRFGWVGSVDLSTPPDMRLCGVDDLSLSGGGLDPDHRLCCSSQTSLPVERRPSRFDSKPPRGTLHARSLARPVVRSAPSSSFLALSRSHLQCSTFVARNRFRFAWPIRPRPCANRVPSHWVRTDRLAAATQALEVENPAHHL